MRGFSSIDGGDLRGRFRWWGLYTQRKEGIDGGKTATLEPEELDAEYFMMRVRIDGGQLNLEQLRTVADISTEFARDTADLTDRQNVQYHWIDVATCPTIWNRLEAVGLSTQEACGDCPRVILGSPVAGISADEIIDATSAIDAIESQFIGDREFSNLPRKFKTAISGHPGHDVVPQINDIAFTGAVHPEHGPASTSGSAAACRPTRCSPSASASGCRSTRCPRSGRASSASSATTATAACAPAPA